MILTTKITGATQYNIGVAKITIDQERAKDLLEYFKIWTEVNEKTKTTRRLYSLEFWDYMASYGYFEDCLSDYEWTTVEEGKEFAEERVDASMIRITDDGVLWTALPHDGDSNEAFETPILWWNDVERIAEGLSPFPLASWE